MSQLYVPHRSMLTCASGVKMSHLNVTHQTSTLTVNGPPRLYGTCKDKMEDNHNCILLNTIGAMIGALCVLPLAVAVAIPSMAIGAVLGGLGGAGAGAYFGGKAGAQKGGEIGSSALGAVGGGAGTIVGGVTGAVGGGVTGAVGGGVSGAKGGAAAGGEVGGNIGSSVGGAFGSVVGGTGGAVKGFVTGGFSGIGDGIREGAEGGREVGGSIGGSIGNVTGSVVGGTGGAVVGTVSGVVSGTVDGAVSGAKKGNEVGTAAGSVVGEVGGQIVGGAIGGVGGAVVGGVAGTVGGALAGGIIGPGAVLGMGAFVGGLINRIPSLCAMISNNTWTLYHPTVKIEGLYALLEKSLLPCFLGGPVKILMVDMERAIKMALISNQIYKDADDISDEMKAMGISVVADKDLPEPLTSGMMSDEDSGFYSRIYKIEDENGTTYVLAFKGTDNANQAKEDWTTNGKQGLGMDEEQYRRTAGVGEKFGEAYQNEQVAVAGHSKAGGQATLAGTMIQSETTVFNSAGVHDNTFERNGTSRENASHVNSFHAQDKDILNTLQDNKSALNKIPIIGQVIDLTNGLPPSSGSRIGMETDAKSLLSDPVDGHTMEPLIEAMKEELRNNPPVNVKATTI